MRGLVAGVLALGVSAGGLALAPAHADDPVDPVEPAPSFRVMTLNIRQDLSAAGWAADAQLASSMTDVLAMQEGNRLANRTAMLDAMHAQGWEAWVPPTGGTELPVAWNASMFSLVSGQTLMVHKGEPGVTPSRWINTVVLQDLATGEDLAIVNTHTINHGAVDAGLQPNDRTPRLKLHIQMLRDQIEAAEQLTPNVIATGDLNVNHLRDRNLQVQGLPTNVLGPVVNFDMPLGRTYDYGNTELDYVMTPIGGNLAPVSAEIVPGFRSDHRGVVDGMVYQDLTGPVPMPANIPPTPPPPPVPTPVPSPTPTPEPPTSNVTFRPATVRNAARGSTSARRAVLSEAVRVINNAPAGSSIHLLTQTLGDQAVKTALLNAVNRGVHLQLFLRGTKINGAEARQRRLLGTDVTQRDWFRAGCASAACRAVETRLSATMLLVSQAGRTPAVRMVTNRSLDRTALDRRARATITTDKATYDRAFHNFFKLVR
jgi:hypothetical protein